jgi:hypothetical protein
VDIWAARAHANGLGDDRAATVAGAVRKVVALQGQDVRATRLAVRVRTAGLTAADVDDAVARADVVRTWAMRGTLHLVAAEDLRWLTAVFGPYFRDRQRPRRRQLGLDDNACARGVAQLETFLHTPMTRAEIVERVDLDLTGQAAPHFLAFAAFSGVVCRGPERGNEPTYVLVDEWVREHGDGRLAERYLLGHGPATAEDLAAWSGLPVTGTSSSRSTAPGSACGTGRSGRRPGSGCWGTSTPTCLATESDRSRHSTRKPSRRVVGS